MTPPSLLPWPARRSTPQRPEPRLRTTWRSRRETPDFAQLADHLRALCGGRVTYLTEFATGKTWGATAEDRVRAAGGVGVSVPASIPMRKRGGRRG